MKTEKDFFISDIRQIVNDLYRNGNSTTVKFTDKEGNIRPQDSKLDRDPDTGTVYILPSHSGVSAHEVFDGGSNRWKINAGTSIPFGLAIAFDLVTPGHVHIVAIRKMKQSEFISLLEIMFDEAEKVTNIKAELQRNKQKLNGRRA